MFDVQDRQTDREKEEERESECTWQVSAAKHKHSYEQLGRHHQPYTTAWRKKNRCGGTPSASSLFLVSLTLSHLPFVQSPSLATEPVLYSATPDVLLRNVPLHPQSRDQRFAFEGDRQLRIQSICLSWRHAVQQPKRASNKCKNILIITIRNKDVEERRSMLQNERYLLPLYLSSYHQLQWIIRRIEPKLGKNRIIFCKKSNKKVCFGWLGAMRAMCACVVCEPSSPSTLNNWCASSNNLSSQPLSHSSSLHHAMVAGKGVGVVGIADMFLLVLLLLL